MKRVFGMVEAIFNIAYLISATIIAVVLFVLANDGLIKILAAGMAFVLVIGDAFHLVPRILVVITKKEDRLRKALGIGKQITSITMTIFYLILFQVGVLVFKTEDIFWWIIIIYTLAIIRIVLCLLPQNKWIERYPPLKWSVWRNIPFFYARDRCCLVLLCKPYIHRRTTSCVVGDHLEFCLLSTGCFMVK